MSPSDFVSPGFGVLSVSVSLEELAGAFPVACGCCERPLLFRVDETWVDRVVHLVTTGHLVTILSCDTEEPETVGEDTIFACDNCASDFQGLALFTPKAVAA